ncbi:RHS repeat domain-containing protein [Pirellulaceae bacterium SH501]
MLETSRELCSARPRTGEPNETFGCAEATTPVSLCLHVHSINASVGPSPDEATTATWRYQRNHQFSITAVTTSSGSVAERYAYTAYGQPTILDGSGSVLSSSAINNRYTYTGREWDQTLGLYHFRARWMSGIAGRFMARDPIGYDGGVVLYRYASGSPLVWNDPSGLIKISPVEDDSSLTGCPSGPGKQKRMVVSWMFRAENRCPSGKGWIVQEVSYACRMGKCPDCPKDAGNRITFFEAWRVSKNNHVPDSEIEGDSETDASEILIPYGTCGKVIADGVIKFFCDEDLPNDSSNPSQWPIGLPPLAFAEQIPSPCPLLATGLPSSVTSPSWWGGYITREAVGWRTHSASWDCCDCGSNFVAQRAFPSLHGGK